MANIVLAAFGSLGDLHPKIAIGLELKDRGHNVTIAAMEFYREKIGLLGLNFARMRPDVDPEDRELVREMMDARNGSERILRDIVFGNIRPMYDINAAVECRSDGHRRSRLCSYICGRENRCEMGVHQPEPFILFRPIRQSAGGSLV